MSLEVNNLDAGDYKFGAQRITDESDGTGSAGDVVGYSDGQLSALTNSDTTSDGPHPAAVLHETPEEAGDDVTVVVEGFAVVVADEAISAGDFVTTAGTEGRVMTANTQDPSRPRAFSDTSGAGELLVIKL